MQLCREGWTDSHEAAKSGLKTESAYAVAGLLRRAHTQTHHPYSSNMEEMVISLVDNDAQFIRQKLDEYNSRFVQPHNHERLSLVAKRENRIIGGLVGGTYWNWLYIELFWVDESERNHGLGTRILAKAEEVATQRGCQNAHLETHDFQSLEFYKRRNYRVFGQLEDLPEGHVKYFLHKRLIQR